MRRTPSRAALLVAALALGLTGCSAGAPRSTPSPSPNSSAPSPAVRTTHRPVVPPPPKADGCYRLTMAELTEPTNDSRPVPCGSTHNTQTVFVGTLHTVVDGHALAVDSDAVQRQLQRTCPARLAGYLGGSPSDRDLSRFRVVWFSPTLQQADQGANWFRCDVVAFARGDRLYSLPPPRKLHRVLDGGNALATYGLCGTAAPGSKGFERVICGLRHSWRAVSTIALRGGTAYPGEKSVSDAGDATCKAQAQAHSSNSLKFSYGWEWPSRTQWANGQHYGYCWVQG